MPHKHDYQLLKRFRWQGTDDYVIVHGCIECRKIEANAVNMKWIPPSQEEIAEAERVAGTLEAFSGEAGK